MFPPRTLAGALVALALATPVRAQSTALTTTGTQGGQWHGASVAILGDTNGDGCDEWAVGSPYYSGPAGPSGKVQVYAGPYGALVLTLLGESPLDQFGASLSSVGDANGDGRADLLVGAPGNGQGGALAGKVYLVDGSTGQAIRAWTGTAAERLGFSVTGMGDVDGDQVPDVLASAPGAGPAPDTGMVRLWSGATGTQLQVWTGLAPGDQFGFCTARAGLVDADLVPDVVIGAPYHDAGGLPDSGRISVWSGATGAQLFTRGGSAAGALFGFSIAGPGDIDGDGLADVVAGAPLSANAGIDSGRAQLLSGNGATVLATWDGSQPGEKFGRTVGAAGDRDADLRPDIVVAAPSWSGPAGTAQGRTLVLSGQSFQPIFVFFGQTAGEEAGRALAGDGDIDGNGRPDLLIGAPRHSLFGNLNAGRARAYPAEGLVPYGLGSAPANSMTLAWTGALGPGALFTLAIQGGPVAAPGTLVATPRRGWLPISGPSWSAVVLVDLSVFEDILLVPFTTGVTGSALLGSALPPVGAINGLTLCMQAIAIGPASDVRLSHGLQATFGY